MDEIYVATDIETDGPSPGHYSMRSFASVAFHLDKEIIGTFERNLEPLPRAKQFGPTMDWWKTQPEAWAAIRKNPMPPQQGMVEYAKWIKTLPATPVFVAHPVSFDYTFVSWYLHEFVGENPFFLAGLDITSYSMAILRQPFTKSHKLHMPESWVNDEFPHTHTPLDDALGHAMTFCNMVAASEKAFVDISTGI